MDRRSWVATAAVLGVFVPAAGLWFIAYDSGFKHGELEGKLGTTCRGELANAKKELAAVGLERERLQNKLSTAGHDCRQCEDELAKVEGLLAAKRTALPSTSLPILELGKETVVKIVGGKLLCYSFPMTRNQGMKLVASAPGRTVYCMVQGTTDKTSEIFIVNDSKWAAFTTHAFTPQEDGYGEIRFWGSSATGTLSFTLYEN